MVTQSSVPASLDRYASDFAHAVTNFLGDMCEMWMRPVRKVNG
jgi:hypothetical protein